MDVLEPNLVWVEGRCYRFFDSCAWSSDRGMGSYEEDSYPLDYDGPSDEASDSQIEIVETSEGRYKHSFRISKIFFPHIVGAKNLTRKKLETETSTSIFIPKQGDGDIVITGSSRRGVVSARQRIDLLMVSTRKKIDFTHFLSIPMNTEEMITNFCKFKDDIVNDSKNTSKPVDDKLFQTPQKLHLTLGVLVLLDDAERQRAAEALLACKTEIIEPFLKSHGPLSIKIGGLNYMNDDPSAIRVLYAKIMEDNTALQELADKIALYFCQIGIMENKFGKVKLHVTVMNTKFRNEHGQRNRKNWDLFDATDILKTYENVVFGTVTLKTIHLSQRHTATNEGYYQATAKIDLSDYS